MLFGQIFFGTKKYIHGLRISLLRWRASRDLKAENSLLSHGILYKSNSAKEQQKLIYFHTRSSGFFSNCSTALADITVLRRNNIHISGIDFSLSMLLYKQDIFANNYADYFSTFDFMANACELDVITPDEAMQNYRDLPLSERKKLTFSYFEPNEKIKELVGRLINNLEIDPERTIAVYYRGTDKAKEIKIADVRSYLELVKSIENRVGSKNIKTILLQTDDAAVQEAFIQEFDDRLRFISELPVSKSKIGLHKSFIFENSSFDGYRQAMYLLASVLILAKCRHLIMTTSNVGLWTSFYRGHANGLYQFGSDAALIRPYND